MGEWLKKGCEKCRQSALIGGGLPIVELGHIGGGHFVGRCNDCGSSWVFTLREAHVVSVDEARKLLPTAF